MPPFPLLRLIPFCAVLAVAPAFAAPADYAFVPLSDHVMAAPDAEIAVRLVHLPDQAPVKNAIIIQSKLEMPMPGMAPIVAKISVKPADGSGIYRFTGALTMTGPWDLKLAAKVQGEAATITGTVPLLVGDAHGHAGH